VSDRLRLFAALELPPAALDALEAFRATADSDVWRPVARESLHVTLAFLGATDAELAGPAGEALRSAATGPAPRLALGGALLLPPRRARVLAVKLDDPDGTLAGLQARVAEALAATGAYAPEGRAFRAHVTVARLRPRARAPRAVGGAPETVTFTAPTLTLFSSRTHPAGARYEALVRAILPEH
jgi:RNA 2',3'-cyclic 3'-phosphodiesterase